MSERKWKVYLSWSQKANQYYIGMTSKVGKPLENYYGTSKIVQSWEDPQKVILESFDKKSEARFIEIIAQMNQHEDSRMVNGNYNIRIFRKHVKDITDDIIYEILERTRAVLEMRLERCSDDVQRRVDSLLRMQLYLSEPEGEA